MKLKYFSLWRDSSLLYASFRMTWFCFLLTIRNLFQWENYFWNAKILFFNCFLSVQSGNSLANWWSVCFKMFFSNVFICVVASATLSHRVWKLFLCSFVLFFKRKGFYYWIAYLSELSWRNSFAMKLYGNCHLNRLFSITKFTEMWWNDGVFEGSEEHRRCSGKVTDFRLAGVEKLFP